MSDIIEQHERAATHFGELLGRVRDDQWAASTPCSEWDVRALVNHVAVEMLWVPPLLEGQTIAEVGDRFDGDQLGKQPLATWQQAASAARDAFAAPGALERTVHLSYGDTPAHYYCRQLTGDVAIHGWDLARATGGDERIDPELAREMYDELRDAGDQLAASGMFGPAVDVPDDADLQTKLLAVVGRRV